MARRRTPVPPTCCCPCPRLDPAALNRRLGQPQTGAEVLFQRIDINVLDRLFPLAETILPAMPLGLSYQNPVRRPIAGAGKPGSVDETFHQPRTVMVSLLEIFHQPIEAHAQKPRSKIAALHTGPDQKTAQAYDSVQVCASLFGIPTNPEVAIGQLQRGCGKTEPTQPAVC